MTEKKSTPAKSASLVFISKGVARVKGTRLSVAQIVSTWKQNDCSSALTADYLEMPLEIIEAALGYYQESSAKIDKEIIKMEEV